MFLFRRIFPQALATLIVAVPLFAWPLAASAQEFVAPVFAVIDVQKVLRDSTALKALSRVIDGERAEYQSGLRETEAELRKADEELARQRTVLSAEAYRQKRNELEQRIAKLQRAAQQRKRAFDQRFAKGMSQIQSALAQVATELAGERGLDMIISKAAVVIVKPKFDLTTEATSRLNVRLPAVSVSEKKK